MKTKQQIQDLLDQALKWMLSGEVSRNQIRVRIVTLLEILNELDKPLCGEFSDGDTGRNILGYLRRRYGWDTIDLSGCNLSFDLAREPSKSSEDQGVKEDLSQAQQLEGSDRQARLGLSASRIRRNNHTT